MRRKVFWLDLAERAVRTVAQAACAAVGVGATGLLDVNWGVGGISRWARRSYLGAHVVGVGAGGRLVVAEPD